MFTQKFSVISSSLYLLNPGEKGVVKKFQTNDEAIIKNLMAMGITPGISITLEQRLPSFVIKVGNTRLAIDREIASTIYVRLEND